MFSILANNYLSVGSSNTYSKSKYVAVDPTSYQGTWTGKYPSGKAFAVTITNVTGFRAQVKYQSAGTVNYQQVLIKDSSFRIGDSKFTLTAAGKATIKTAITDPVTNAISAVSGYATLQT
jgi:hypothetical protein